MASATLFVSMHSLFSPVPSPTSSARTKNGRSIPSSSIVGVKLAETVVEPPGGMLAVVRTVASARPFAAWQQEWLQGETLALQVAYWKEQLSGAPAVITLPTDLPRPKMQSTRGRTYIQMLPAAFSPALADLSQTNSSTLFMTLFTAYNVLLARYSQQDDLVVGKSSVQQVTDLVWRAARLDLDQERRDEIVSPKLRLHRRQRYLDPRARARGVCSDDLKIAFVDREFVAELLISPFKPRRIGHHLVASVNEFSFVDDLQPRDLRILVEWNAVDQPVADRRLIGNNAVLPDWHDRRDAVNILQFRPERHRWRAYPSGHGNKVKTYASWRSHGLDKAGSVDERNAVMAGLHAWKSCERWAVKGMVKAAETWVKERWWADDPPPPDSVRIVTATQRHNDPQTMFDLAERYRKAGQ